MKRLASFSRDFTPQERQKQEKSRTVELLTMCSAGRRGAAVEQRGGARRRNGAAGSGRGGDAAFDDAARGGVAERKGPGAEEVAGLAGEDVRSRAAAGEKERIAE